MDQTQLALLAMLGALAARFWEQTAAFADPKTSPATKIGLVYVTCLLLAALSGSLNETFTLTAAGFRSLFFSAALMATCSQAFHIFLNSAVPGLGDVLNGLFGNNKITQTTSKNWTVGETTNSSSVVSEKTVVDKQLPPEPKIEDKGASQTVTSNGENATTSDTVKVDTPLPPINLFPNAKG